MKKPSIANLFSSGQVAMCPMHAQTLLSLPMPKMTSTAVTASAMVERGERFAISRGVAVVPVKGLLTPNMYALERYMGWATYHGLERTMDELAANEEVSAIVLEIDTPGGYVLALQAAASAIRRAKSVKPVHALVNPLCASAGYWLGSQATSIAATPGSLIGSIGVALVASSFARPDIFGKKMFSMTSSHARAKRPDPATDEGQKELQRSLDETEALFHADISTGRNIPLGDLSGKLSVTDNPVDGGAVFEVSDAINRGLIDTAETRDAFYNRIFGQYAPKPTATRRALSSAAQAAMATAIAQT